MGTGASISICQSLSSVEIKYCRNKVGPQPQRTFGIPLDYSAQDETQYPVPPIVKHLVGYLEEFGLNHKGLFRISGSVTKIKALKQKYDQGEEVDLVNEGDVNSIASLLKLFLNELPVAVLPDNLCANILATFEDNKNYMAECTRCLKRLLSSLPKAHYSLFHFLIRFLVKVAAYSDVNHMTMENLAIVFGPALFRIPCSPSAPEKQTVCNAILLHFLQHHEELFADCPDTHFSLTEAGDPQILSPAPLSQGPTQQTEEIHHP
ncbi:protein FAM13A-like [Zootoca vivipara]|uniref:protein FAM13A-like n=1 Tax=Zootoca vivipara TaxID=8524 RepID=UPI00159243A3|nr:protein FAM13A-like [Zootoca vivipara]XP_060130959.1 protein FAM13A-like [Zootoca vivipara]